MDKWRAMIAAQGGDVDAPLPVAKETETIVAPRSGVLTKLDAYAVGVAVRRLGAGRARKEDAVQAAAGIEIHVKPGDRVDAGQPVLTLHTDTPERFGRAVEALEGGWAVGHESAGALLEDILAGAAGAVASMGGGAGALSGTGLVHDRSVVLDRIG
jgi:thymidine phosphorylase